MTEELREGLVPRMNNAPPPERVRHPLSPVLFPVEEFLTRTPDER